MSGSEHHDNHGQSLAAWVGIGILLVASCMMAVAVAVTNWGLFWAGAILSVLGVIAGKVLAMAGYGVDKPAHKVGATQHK
ncbi:MAG: hypothetical protein CSA84_01345 [Actinomycetales bacterium]|nr:MAG: hypothetical protein CSA84_01345 [Actinomycetales bacterium]